ncbi:MAG: PEP-CTERM sorting domain-containing protein, partial [Planctomycetaceae bacterium]
SHEHWYRNREGVTGNIIGGLNDANYKAGGLFCVTQDSNFDANQNYLVNVGAVSGASYYGTFDQSGNVREWNDLDGVAGLSRGLRGGGYDNFLASSISSSQRGTPAATNLIAGFRLAGPVAVPEPSTWAMGLTGLACAGLSLVRRKRS